ncbi:MAG: iron ABC transporter permease [Acidimicrobiia bacterium]
MTAGAPPITRPPLRRRTVALRLPSTTLRLRPIVPVALAGLVLTLLALTVAHLVVGEAGLPVATVLDVLRGGGHPDDRFVVTELRLPRPLVAMAAGAAFGMSGTLLQRLSGNDLASPDLVGVVGGANLGVAVLYFGFPDQAAAWRLPAAALGGLSVGLLVLAAAGFGRAAGTRVLLVGAGVGVVAQAVVSAIVAAGSLVFASRIVLWTVGGLYGRSWTELNMVLNAGWILVPAAVLVARNLDHLDVGDDLATGLGVDVGRTRAVAALVATGLAVVAVTAVGPIAFVGLVAPHLGRRLVGPATAALLAVSAATGAVVVVLADLVGRTLMAPTEIPTGALVPFVGVPVLLGLLHRRAVAT